MLSCHIWHVDKMKFASLEVVGGGGRFSLSHSFFPLPLSGRSPDMTEILLPGT